MIRIKKGAGRVCYTENRITKWADPGDVISLDEADEQSLIRRGAAEPAGIAPAQMKKAAKDNRRDPESEEDDVDEMPTFEAAPVVKKTSRRK